MPVKTPLTSATTLVYSGVADASGNHTLYFQGWFWIYSGSMMVIFPHIIDGKVHPPLLHLIQNWEILFQKTFSVNDVIK